MPRKRTWGRGTAHNKPPKAVAACGERVQILEVLSRPSLITNNMLGYNFVDT